MIYREFLVMRKAVLWFVGITIAAMLIMVIVQLAQSHGGTLSTDLDELQVPVAWVVTVFAAIFGVALGNASRGPARVLWVLPVERWKQALQMFAVDALGIIAAYAGVFAGSILFFLIMGLFEPVRIRGSIDWAGVGQSLLFVYAVYGWSVMVGTIGRRVAYCGLASLPLLLFWLMFAQAGGTFGRLLRAPIAANPYAVYQVSLSLEHARIFVGLQSNHDVLSQSLFWMGTTWEVPLLVMTALLTCGIAMLLWQRAEAIN